MKWLGVSARVGLLAVMAFASARMVLADPAVDCERYAGEADIGGNTVYLDTGVCQPSICPAPAICADIMMPGIPASYLCACGATGNPCTLEFAGTPGQHGAVSCRKLSCANPCSAPVQKVNPDGGYVTFTAGGNTYYVLTCPCP